jgi:capsule polysaccharide export protein KpsE/RkpR
MAVFKRGFVMPDDGKGTQNEREERVEQERAGKSGLLLTDLPRAEARIPTQPLRGREPLDPGAERLFVAARGGPATQLPRRRERRSFFTIFVLLVVLVIGCAGTYYYAFMATPRYVTEIHLTVRSSDLAQQNGTVNNAIFGLGNTTGAAYSDSFLVAEYLRSPAVVDDIGRKIDLRAMFSQNWVDPLSRLKKNATEEDLVKYWQSRVLVDYDPITATVSMTVQAFTADQSYQLAMAAKEGAEALVNRMDDQARNDVLKFATSDLARAKAALNADEAKLAFPSTLDMQVAQQLRVDRDFAQTDYTNAMTQLIAAKNIATLTQRYLVMYVPPVRPISPIAPIRWQSILIVWLATIMGAGVFVLFSATIREHLL